MSHFEVATVSLRSLFDKIQLFKVKRRNFTKYQFQWLYTKFATLVTF